MGNELAHKALQDALIHDLSKLEANLRQRQTSQSEQVRHGWNSKDASDNIAVSDDFLTIQRGKKANRRDGIRGKIGYKDGVHFFEFRWRPGPNKRVAIGVATKDAELTAKGDNIVLGADDESAGFDMVTREIYFNGLPVKHFPAKKPADFVLPSPITMVLNMDKGTLSFKTDQEDYGVAMRGLEHMSEELYVAGSLDKAGDQITMKYLGSSDDVKGSTSTTTAKLCFHTTHGQNIVLTDNSCRAQRKNPKDCFNNAIVLTNRPMKDGETFKLLLTSKDGSRWRGSWMFGVTTTSPIELNFPTMAPEIKQGDTWLYNENKIVHNRQVIEELNGDIDDLDPGSTVAVEKSGSKVFFYIDGVKQCTVPLNTTGPVFGVVDVYGRATSVAIADGKAQVPKHLSQMRSSEDIRPPQTAEEFLSCLKEAVQLLKKKDQRSIPKTRKVVEIYLDQAYHRIKDRKMRRIAADRLAGMDAAKIFTEYLKFLHQLGNDSNADIIQADETLRNVCWNYADNSMVLAKNFGDAGLLDFLIEDLKANCDDYRSSKHKIIRVLSDFGILHNCAKVTDNRPIYKNKRFIKIAKAFCDAKTNPDIIVMPCTFTMSYVFEDDEIDDIKLPESTAQQAVTTLAGAVQEQDTHQYDGWHSYELAVGMHNLSANPSNVKLLIQKGAIKHLLKMLDFQDPYEIECALNAMWSLTTPTNKFSIAGTPGLMEKVGKLCGASKESVQQAAIRLKMKLQVNESDQSVYEAVMYTKIPKMKCNYKDICIGFLKTLGLSEEYFDTSNDICYCINCHGSRGVKNTVKRGQPPKEYGIPVGWFRFGLKLPARAKVHKAQEQWHRAYHGTRKEHIRNILEVGDIVPAGRAVLGGGKVKEQPFHFNDEYKPLGFDTKQVFLSPSIRYAGIDTYAEPSQYRDPNTRKGYTARVAVHVLISPGSYGVGPETVGADTEIDPAFSNQELEWFTNQQGATMLYGILVKLEG